MTKNERVVSFEKVSFDFGYNKPILDEADFSVRNGMKVTLMGQNGAGKSTIFQLITKALKPGSGKINIVPDLTIALSRQVIPREQLDLTVRAFFETTFANASASRGNVPGKKMYDLDGRIDDVLEVVNLKGHEKLHDRKVGSFSGGQQARLLLASALIQNPDLLLLDEPTNNLDKAGIEHLTQFLIDYEKTVIVISHDADFLNAFTDGVLYLDVFTHKIEQYFGNYYDVAEQIADRIAKENMKNAQLAKEIQENKDKANFFAHKGGKMRAVAKRMRETAEELEEERVDVRQEDKTIRPFTIPMQEDIVGEIINITSFNIIDANHKPLEKKTNISLKRGQHLLLRGPNGIGKSTLLESIASGHSKGSTIAKGIKVGYYRQDFSNFDFEDTVYNVLILAMVKKDEEYMRSVAAGFLINAELIRSKIGSLSEGQKGLVSFARLVFEKPGLLILDEPTNHINFRHIPLIAEALDKYQGAMILVSHVPEFVDKIRIDEVLDLEK